MRESAVVVDSQGHADERGINRSVDTRDANTRWSQSNIFGRQCREVAASGGTVAPLHNTEPDGHCESLR